MRIAFTVILMMLGCKTASHNSQVREAVVTRGDSSLVDRFYLMGESLESPKLVCWAQCEATSSDSEPDRCEPAKGAVSAETLRNAKVEGKEAALIDAIFSPTVGMFDAEALAESGTSGLDSLVSKFSADTSGCDAIGESFVGDPHEGGDSGEGSLNLLQDGYPAVDRNNLFRNKIKIENPLSEPIVVDIQGYVKFDSGRWGWSSVSTYRFSAREPATNITKDGHTRWFAAYVYKAKSAATGRVLDTGRGVFDRFYANDTYTIRIGSGGGSNPSPSTCVYNGRSYRVGTSFPSTDGCNECSCGDNGGVRCTERACADRPSVPAITPNMCIFLSSQSCDGCPPDSVACSLSSETYYRYGCWAYGRRGWNSHKCAR